MLRIRRIIKASVFIALTMLVVSCNSEADVEKAPFKPCKTDQLILNSEGLYPELKFNMQWPFDTINSVVQDLFDEDLCNSCGRQSVGVKIPFSEYIEDINGDSILLRIEIPFDSPCCPSCPIAMRDDNYFRILVNEYDHILAESSRAELTDLDSMMTIYWNESAGLQRRYNIQWKPGASRECIDQILYIICENYLFQVELEYEKKVCDLSFKEILQIRKEFPLNIQFSSCFDEIKNLSARN